MEAPRPADTSRKRKFDRVDDEEPPGSGGAGDGANLDFIGSLPDAVLGTIISLLPTKDGVRTQAISRRWRPLWRSAPLNLVVDYNLSGQERKRVVFVSNILTKHRGPALRLSISCIRVRHYSKIECWLRSQSLTNLQELRFSYSSDEDLPSPPPMPPSALSFAPTLTIASFSCCKFPNLSAQSLNFPHLKQLSMYEVTISEDALHNMLSGCPALESLLLQYMNIGHLHISSPSLRASSTASYFCN
ncbi:hypothetical protein BRADI_1g66172v3 [Brachypodium distachyon]|uniref:F-box domain-containing protein n=1 Tax=Brachypodium distachyon TaxID=15368 RepID=A0A0Q3KCX2_BRADI|nr:hypothetical protein BRADI_1g66172v3 [Brachypodium distachyon]PNT77629.1 hypothetical protein BRADI_1g66172v3 [Brachypodium distachyon]PNT77630.1 hypothetical protein BRADI_1g66172v3 [Brachypodium distachyon]PNT77631.1 hypothetical protein BRADI_1g66172v3 [Brachypodium distachyon]PNT77632.1 hypothetical protein BRADI_1g66172v3 [Brachypodium distachyon]